jgi:hypothetical protein
MVNQDVKSRIRVTSQPDSLHLVQFFGYHVGRLFPPLDQYAAFTEREAACEREAPYSNI